MTSNGNRTMNADEDYGMDVAGFIHVAQVLSAAQVAACNEAIDAAGSGAGSFELPALLEHPVLTSYVETLCGSGYLIDKPPTLVADNADSAVAFWWIVDRLYRFFCIFPAIDHWDDNSLRAGIHYTCNLNPIVRRHSN